jgi:hypothetical protein
MSEERKRLIREFIRAAFLYPEYLKLYEQAFEVMAVSEGKRLKNGEAWEKACKRVMSDEFIDDLKATFPSLAIEDIIDLTMFHQSIAKKKFRKAEEVKDFGVALHDALYKEFVE